MRITARVASDKERWSVEFPRIDGEKLFPWVNGKRTAKYEEVRKALKSDFIVHSSRDTAYLECLAARFIEKLNEWKDKNAIGSDVAGYDRTIQRLARKIEREHITYARAEFTTKIHEDGNQTVTFDITTKNDWIVESHRWEELFAMLMTEAAKIVSAECVDCGYPAIEFTERANKMYDDLMKWRANEKRKRLVSKINARRRICLHHRNGFCSPRLSKCPCYKNGKCEEVK